MYRFSLFATLLCACSLTTPDPVTPEPTPADTDEAPVCDITVSETTPEQGEAYADYRAPIEFRLDEADPTATVIASFPGEQATREDGKVITYTPTEPLSPNTEYDVTLDYCHGAPTISFTTDVYGSPLEVPVENLIGRTYAIDLLDANYPGTGNGLPGLASNLFSEAILMEVVLIDDGQIGFRVALPEWMNDGSIRQDTCARTVDLPMASLEGPYFSVADSDVAFGAYTSDMVLADFAISGTFSPMGDSIGAGAFNAVLDVRDLSAIIETFPADSMCRIAGELDAPCQPCATDGAPYCVHLDATHITAELVWDVDVASITDPESDPACDLGG